jgi:uncharacterized membrane protein
VLRWSRASIAVWMRWVWDMWTSPCCRKMNVSPPNSPATSAFPDSLAPLRLPFSVRLAYLSLCVFLFFCSNGKLCSLSLCWYLLSSPLLYSTLLCVCVCVYVCVCVISLCYYSQNWWCACAARTQPHLHGWRKGVFLFGGTLLFTMAGLCAVVCMWLFLVVAYRVLPVLSF